MSSYFDEHDCLPTESTPATQAHDLMELLRNLLSNNLYDDLIPMSEKLAPPAAKQVVRELPRKKADEINDKEDGKCPVCLLPYDNVVIEMPCTHCFHSSCLIPWLEKTNSCPMCRYELLTDSPQYEEWKKQQEQEKERQFRVDQLHNSMFG